MTSVDTLTHEKDTFFSTLFSGNFKTDFKNESSRDEYFIDRDPTYFGLILNHLRGSN
jgi:hypothetical protein